jgi:fructosamine-3-kinase
MFAPIESTLKNHFGAAFTINEGLPLYGGDINQVYKLNTSKGTFVVKINQSGLPNLFETEAKGLQLLKENSGFHIPSVVKVDTSENGDFILMEYISSGEKSASYWQKFGEELALMHQQTHEHFGMDHNNYIGSLHQSNEVHEKWSSFYFHERILKQLDLLGGTVSV